MKAALVLENVSIRFPLRAARGRSKGGVRRALGGVYATASRSQRVAALSNIWLSLTDGDRLAIIGRNGSGKSTLLRTMAGVYSPSVGRIWRHGSVAPILSAAAGFVPAASGYENIFLRGMLLGMTRAEIEHRIPSILAFAELGDWIEQPVMTYSSGMSIRLAFAICTSINPNILLFDEWIGAGDARFIQRASDRLQALVSSSNIMVLASHRDAILRKFCNRAIVLDGGVIAYDGGVSDALGFYGELIKTTSYRREQIF